MKFRWGTLLVRNMEESLKFYTEIIGLEISARDNPMPGLEIAFLGSGDTLVELVCSAEAKDAVVGDAVSWGFEVASLDDALRMVREKGIPLHSGPVVRSSVKYFFILDPNSLKIQLKETIK
ncbi:MAG: VOC family protein [Clostridiales bacterium]|nr:VOC family protein [Clostridiales bacterium]